MMLRLWAVCAVAVILLAPAARAEDRREMVAMPEAAQQRLLQGMHDHMSIFTSILSYLGNERFESAARMAETQLPLGPLDPDLEQDVLTYLPPGMLEARVSLREAGKRLAAAARKAETDRTYFRMKKVTAAISDVQAACAMCHAHYRIR